MKVGDLVTLSSYCLQRASMWSWRERAWREKKPIVGLITKIENNPWQSKKDVSPNESVFYYIKWVTKGPESRWGRSFSNADGYFLRNDLKFVNKGDY